MVNHSSLFALNGELELQGAQALLLLCAEDSRDDERKETTDWVEES